MLGGGAAHGEDEEKAPAIVYAPDMSVPALWATTAEAAMSRRPAKEPLPVGAYVPCPTVAAMSGASGAEEEDEEEAETGAETNAPRSGGTGARGGSTRTWTTPLPIVQHGYLFTEPSLSSAVSGDDEDEEGGRDGAYAVTGEHGSRV